MFTMDFSMSRGHELIISREQGIRRDELDEIELQMLQSSRIPQMLPIEWFELDGVITFRYALSGRKMLSHKLQMQQVTMEQFYTMLLSIVEVLNECRHYMLRPEGCLLDDQYLFVGEQISDIAVAYVPLKDIDLGGSVPGMGSLMPLVVRWTAYIDIIDGEGLQRILQHLSGSGRPLAELRTTLLELIGREITSPLPGKQQQAVQEYVRSEPAACQEIDDRQNWSEELPPYEFELEDEHSAPESRTSKWVLSAAILIAVACAWRFLYMPNMAKGGFLMSAGLSVTGLVGLAVLWLKGQRESNFEQEPDDFIPISLPLGERSGGVGKFSAAVSMPVPSSGPYYGEAASIPSAYPFSTLPKTQLGTPEPTVLLGKEDREQSVHSSRSAWLQREWRGEHTKLLLTEKKFTIGRAGENVSYEDVAEGISRLHLEVELLEGEVYQVKDIGSRNGSLLNGQTMIPYKAYKLELEDTIQLAGTSGPKYVLKR